MTFNSIAEIIEEIQAGKIVVILDDEREHEGDMIVAAEFATEENIGFMMRHGCGIICVPITQGIAKRFQLDLLPRRDCDDTNDCFNTVSFDAKNIGGVSASDRSKSISTLINDAATAHDIKTPGHVFPLIANPEGLFARPGHTEAAVDLMKLAGLKPAAALVEVMNDDKDKVATIKELIDFAAKHCLKIATVRSIIDYKKANQS